MDPNLYSANFGMQPEADQASSSENPTPVVQTTDGADATDDTLTKTDRDPRYPMAVQYCGVCSLPGEVHAYVSRSQFEKCKEWLRNNEPEHFPDLFPDECAAKLESLKIAEESGGTVGQVGGDIEKETTKVAVPIEQKTSGGKKKKAPVEIVLALGQRKGKKQVTIVYGLDLFGIKLKDAAKAAKRKFATGSSITTSADNREVVEIQGSRQEDFADLVHDLWGVPKEAIYIINTQKKKVRAFP